MDKTIFNISPYSFTGSAFFIGLILANELSSLEQISVGNWLQLVGLTIQTYSSQHDVIENLNIIDDKDELDSIKKALSKINEELNKIKKT